MLNSNPKDAEDLRIYQIIDANLDRAREGLRVLEDWARFGLGQEKIVERIKNFRQIPSFFKKLKITKNNIQKIKTKKIGIILYLVVKRFRTKIFLHQ